MLVRDESDNLLTNFISTQVNALIVARCLTEFRSMDYSHRTSRLKELFDDGEEDISRAGGAVAQVDGGGSRQLQRDQCGELPGSDPSSEEAIEEPGSAFLQPEKAEEPASGEAKS